MDKLKANLASGVTALWLTLSGCTMAGDHEAKASDGVRSQNDQPALFLQEATPYNASADNTLDAMRSMPFPDAKACESGLVDLLVTRDIYESLQEGTSLAISEEYINKPLSEQINAYKAQRMDELSKIFCDPQKPEVAELATALIANPADMDSFKKLQVTLLSEHMDVLQENYSYDDFQDVVKSISDFVLNANMKVIEQLGEHFDRSEFDHNISLMAAEHYERFVFLATNADMADLFDTEAYMDENPHIKLRQEVTKEVLNDVFKEVGEAVQTYQQIGPMQRVTYSF